MTVVVLVGAEVLVVVLVVLVVLVVGLGKVTERTVQVVELVEGIHERESYAAQPPALAARRAHNRVGARPRVP